MTSRFPSRRSVWTVACGLLLAMALLAGCGKKDGTDGGKRDGRGDAGADTAARNNNLLALDTPSTMPHPEGEFVATWPSGCARIRTRTVPSSAGDGRDAVVRAECYRDGDAARGCSVSVWFERPDGGPLSVEDVTAAVARGIGDRRLQI
ncbi:hypothetical protein HGA89_04760, partial [bacterium]|nr:hypothetical protein [bacterium]